MERVPDPRIGQTGRSPTGGHGNEEDRRNSIARPRPRAGSISRRRKCILPAGCQSCVYCGSRGVKCIQEPPKGGYYESRASSSGRSLLPRHSHSASRDSDVNANSELPSLPLQIQLVRLYFDYVHDQFHSLFHRPTFEESVAKDEVPHVILHAIIALSARFSSDPFFGDTDPRERGRPYFQESARLLNVQDISLPTVQACVLLGAASIADGDDAVETIYYSIGCRIAQLLNLPTRPAASRLEREINVRVWWSLCMVDVWSSTAVKLPKLMPTTSVPLPMDEIPFLSLRYDPPLSPASELFDPVSPLLSQMIQLNRILLAINDFNQRCVTEHLQGSMLETNVEILRSRLDAWTAALPANMYDTEANFAWYASRGLGRMFAAVYLGYYHFGQLLFYQFLHMPGSKAAPSAAAYAELCKDHAGKLCEMIYRSFRYPGCDVLYTMVAHVLVIASTVQIHTLLFSADDEQIRVAKARLERNFEILLHLKPFWRTLDRTMTRLRSFQETCKRSMDTSFVLDRWLLRFLVEFATALEEKPVGEMDKEDQAALCTLQQWAGMKEGETGG